MSDDTKPETEWVWVPKEPTPAMIGACSAALRVELNKLPAKERCLKFPPDRNGHNVPRDLKAVWRYKAMLAASPPAPSVPGVVREWKERPSLDLELPPTHEQWLVLREWGRLGDGMVATLTQKQIEWVGMKSEVQLCHVKLAAQATRIAELEVVARAYADFEDVQKVRAAEATVTELRAEVAKLQEPGGLTVNCLRLGTCSEKTRLAAEVERLRIELGETKLVLESQDLRLHKFKAEHDTAESALETARGALEPMRKVVEAAQAWGNATQRTWGDTSQALIEALAALPSPPAVTGKKA